MGRLIEKNEQGIWALKGVPWESLSEGQLITKDTSERLYGALYRLKEYEDTGLSPDNVKNTEYALLDAAERLEVFYGMETGLIGEIKNLLAKFSQAGI